MKFTDLPPSNRSILAALCAAGAAGLRTDALGRCTSPRHHTPQEAANLLNNLRQLGLVYSQQKPDNQSYALWKASEYGLAVFMGRPADVQPERTVTSSVPTCGAVPTKRFIISEAGGLGHVATCTREEALDAAQSKATSKPGTVFRVYEQVAEAHMPVPQAMITLL